VWSELIFSGKYSDLQKAAPTDVGLQIFGSSGAWWCLYGYRHSLCTTY